VLHADDLPPYPGPTPAEATVVFLTPTQIRHANQPGDLTQFHQFHVLFRSLARRVALLDYFHCGGEWGPGPRALLEQAQAIETSAHSLRWHQWERYSARQRQRVPMGGWVGRVTYRGDLAPFWPWLHLGQWLHVGKHATFGLGQYRIQQVRLRTNGAEGNRPAEVDP
jgi:CRISPR/Cas system endoribonuclease Cas6 (RAMP superfamily)